MVGYKLCNTVTENGYVSRGVCEMNEAGELIGIRERTRIEHHENGIAFTEDDGATWTLPCILTRGRQLPRGISLPALS